MCIFDWQGGGVSNQGEWIQTGEGEDGTKAAERKNAITGKGKEESLFLVFQGFS